MKKTEILIVLFEKINKIEYYIDIFENEEELFFLKETLLNVKATLIEIKNDIEENIVPIDFFSKIEFKMQNYKK